MVTPEEVLLAYRLFLGREPESADCVINLCQSAQSVAQLCDAFLTSSEFLERTQMPTQPRTICQRHPFHLPRIPVETEVSAEVLEQMFSRIQKEWEHLGRTEPYWSVVTQPQYYKAEFEQHREQFYASGTHSGQLFLAAIRRAGLNPAVLETCLEIGCGVGRVTGFLAEAFKKIIAVDIASSHLDLARIHLAQKGVTNVELRHHQTARQLENLPQVDAIYSVITLQHNPPPIMAWMLRTLLSKLRAGGVAFIQLPTYRNGYMFEIERYLNSKPPTTLEMHFLPQPNVFRLVAQAGCHCLEVREDEMVGNEALMLSNTFIIGKA